MTELQPAPALPSPPANAWNLEFDKLRARFPRVQERVLFCIHALQQEADPRMEDLRALAGLHGLRITAASLHAAKRLLGLEPARRKPGPKPKVVDPSAWESARAAIAAEFPKVKPGILYAVFRLRQDPDVRLPDIRADAEAAGIKIGGRSLHSARALIAGRKTSASAGGRVAVVREDAGRPSGRARQDAGSPEQLLRRFVSEVEAKARDEVQRLRKAIAAAIKILREV